MSEKTEQQGEAWAEGHYTEWCGGASQKTGRKVYLIGRKHLTSKMRFLRERRPE